jgi:hypothetical protein
MEHWVWSIWQLAVGSWQLAVGSWQLAVGKEDNKIQDTNTQLCADPFLYSCILLS